jgi:hypothetical protein
MRAKKPAGEQSGQDAEINFKASQRPAVLADAFFSGWKVPDPRGADRVPRASRLRSSKSDDAVSTSAAAVTVRAGSPQPDISSAEALERALLSAKSVIYAVGLSGVHFARVLDRLGRNR